MTKKLLMLIGSLLFVVCVTLGLSACGSDNDRNNNENDNISNVSTISTNSLVFGYDVDRNELENYFITNGQKTSATSNDYCISNNLATIYYTPKSYQFNIIRQITGNSTLSNAAYQYKYTCGMQINLYSLLSTAKFVGEYNHSALNLNTLNVTAEYTANFKFTVDKFNSNNEICDFSNVKYTSQITNATNWASANRMFEPKETGETIFNQFQSCINAVSQIFANVNNKDFSTEYNAANYTNLDFTNVSLNSVSEKIDGSAHSIYASNIPNNVFVEYTGNEQSEIGNHTVTATFKDPKGNILHTLNGNIEITDVFNVTVQYIYGNIVAINGEKGFVVGEQTFEAKYNSNILEYCNFPAGFIWQDTSDNWQANLRDNYEWQGYGDQTFTVSVVPEYEGYVQVSSDTNSSANGAIIEFSSLCSTYENNIQSAKLYGSDNLITFKPSDIKSLKFFNTDYISSIDGTYYTNLETIDLADCIHLKSINGADEYTADGFFENCKSLKQINAPSLPNLKTIGNYFLANTNIIEFNFDMSAVEEIGSNFMNNALWGKEERTITIDLKNISSINSIYFLSYLSTTPTNTPTINLYIYDYKIWEYDCFDKQTNFNIYVSSQLDYFNQLFADYPNVYFYQIESEL